MTTKAEAAEAKADAKADAKAAAVLATNEGKVADLAKRLKAATKNALGQFVGEVGEGIVLAEPVDVKACEKAAEAEGCVFEVIEKPIEGKLGKSVEYGVHTVNSAK